MLLVGILMVLFSPIVLSFSISTTRSTQRHLLPSSSRLAKFAREYRFPRQPLGREKRINGLCSIPAEELIENEDDENDLSDIFPLLSARKLWLDLRKTALSPQEALYFLEDRVVSEKEKSISNLVDCILLSEKGFSKAAAAPSQSFDKLSMHQMNLMYVTDTGQQLIASNDDTQQSFPAGKVMTCHSGQMLDPFFALEAISSIDGRPGWIVVDSDDELEEKEQQFQEQRKPSSSSWREEQITSLYEFLSTSLSAPKDTASVLSSKIESGLQLILPGGTSGSSGGGMAVSCPTKTAFLGMSAALMKTECATQMITSTTDSGIVLPTGMQTSSTSIANPFATALILPVDIALWQTVFDLQSQYK